MSGGKVETLRDEICEVVLDRFRDPTFRVPVLPALALELIALARQPHVTFKQLAAVVHQEPVLAAQVLRLARSPLYRRGHPARTIEQAAALLGVRALVELFLEASVSSRLFRAPGYEVPMQRMRQHAVHVAHVTRSVCRAAGFSEDVAFACGLLHDVGMVAGLIAAKDLLVRPSFETLEPVLRTLHGPIGLIVAEQWRLPEDVIAVIKTHHDPVGPLSQAVYIAEQFVDDPSNKMPSERPLQRAVAVLGLSETMLGNIFVDSRRVRLGDAGRR